VGIYKREGAKGLQAQRRGRRVGEQRTLFVEQELAIQRLICDKTPDQYKRPFALWTRQAVQELITRRLKVRMPIRTVGDSLTAGGAPHKSRSSAPRSNVPLRCAKQEQAEIHWGDETGMRNDRQHGRRYAPRGHTPVIRLSAKRASMNMLSTVSNQGTVRFMIDSGTMTAQRLLQFFKQLITAANKKVLLLPDNLRVHHAKLVKEWLATKHHAPKLEVFFLPAYSPEMNPDEYVNGEVRAGVHAKPPVRDTATLKRNIHAHMRMVQRSPARVSKYFNHPKIA